MASEGKVKTAVAGGVNLTQRDLAVVAAAWQSIEGEPKIDYEKFTTLAGYGSVGSARACWCDIKKKLLAVGAGDGSSSSSTTTINTSTTPKKSSAKKASGRPTTTTRTTTTSPSSTVKSEGKNAMDIDELSGPNTSASSSSASSYRGDNTPSKAASTQGKKRNRRPMNSAPATGDGEIGDGSPRKKKGRITTIKAESDRKKAEAALPAVIAAGAEVADGKTEVQGEEVGGGGDVKPSVGGAHDV